MDLQRVLQQTNLKIKKEIRKMELRELESKELMEVEGGIPFILGVLAAGGIVAGSAIVVGGATYAVKKGCEYVGSLFK